MYFTLHKAQLERALAFCQNLRPADALQPLLCAGLHSLLQHCELYDGCIMRDNPFLQELGEILAHLDAENRFSLLECLIILLREKELRRSGRTDEEGRVLRYFEQSGEWAPDDGTLISLWYWVRLPQTCTHA